MQAEAEHTTWAMGSEDIIGVGHDESRLVRVEVDRADTVRYLEIGSSWWRVIGAHGLGEAVRVAVDAAVNDRMTAWADRAAARSQSPAPEPDGRPFVPPVATAPAPQEQIAELRRTLDMLRQVRSELKDYRRFVKEQAGRENVGADSGSRAQVTVTGQRITGIRLDSSWLNTQPSGQVVADTIRTAIDSAYRKGAQQTAAALASMPAIAAALPGNADPAALLRRLGVG
ncbi:MAG TPA: hypothetical protein VN408_11085 [Actinoplanes sp.]|nr:hypothetical protein [Actinoplanes sp.]